MFQKLRKINLLKIIYKSKLIRLINKDRLLTKQLSYYLIF